MGRKGHHYRKIKSILVSINSIAVSIQLNEEEQIKDKEEAAKVLQLSALEFKKTYPKSKSNRIFPSYQTIKKDNVKNEQNILLNSNEIKIFEKPSPENPLIVPHENKETNVKFIQKSNFEGIKEIEKEPLDKYESRIISDWDRLWGDVNDQNFQKS